MSSIKDRDYSFMRGTEVLIVDGSEENTQYIHCFVAGCDINKGISIVDINDPNNEMVCINKEEIESEVSKMYGGDNYYGCFASTISKCKKGKLPAMLSDQVRKRNRDYFPYGSQASCAFK